jgi:hypothetical protein
MIDTVTATAIAAGNIELYDCGEIQQVPVAVVLQFASLDDLRLAITRMKNVRIEWTVPNPDKKESADAQYPLTL